MAEQDNPETSMICGVHHRKCYLWRKADGDVEIRHVVQGTNAGPVCTSRRLRFRREFDVDRDEVLSGDLAAELLGEDLMAGP